jgi:hypothetical protein
VIGALHDEPRDLRRILDAFERGDRSRAVRRPIHHGRIELHDAVFVRDAAVPDGEVVRIFFDEIDTRDGRIQRRAAVLHHLHGLLRGLPPVQARYHDRPLCAPPARHASIRPRPCGGDAIHQRGADTSERGFFEERAAGFMLRIRHGAWPDWAYRVMENVRRNGLNLHDALLNVKPAPPSQNASPHKKSEPLRKERLAGP